MDGPPHLGAPGGFDVPSGFDASMALRADPLTFGDDEPMTARVLVDGSHAAAVVDELGESTVVERRSDGSVIVELAVVNRPAFRSFVLGLLDHAEVLAPTALRDDLVDWLGAIVEAP